MRDILCPISTDSPQRSHELSCSTANSALEHDDELPTPSASSEQRSRFCTLFYAVFLPLYAVVGAFLFFQCEGSNTDELIWRHKNRCVSERDQVIDELRTKFENGSQHLFSFEDFQDAIMMVDRCLRNGSAMEPKEVTYVSAGMFIVNVMTTVGYGDVVPYTILGRIVTMLFAAIGIPFYVAFTADFSGWISNQIANFYRWLKKVYLNVFKRTESATEDHWKPVSDMTMFLIVLAILVVFLFSHAYTTMVLENATSNNKWTYLDSVYFVFTTITLVGFGDLVTYNTSIFMFIHLPVLLLGKTIVALYSYFIQVNAVRYKIPVIVKRWYSSRFGKESKKEVAMRKRMGSDLVTVIERHMDENRERKWRRRQFQRWSNAFFGRKKITLEGNAVLLPAWESTDGLKALNSPFHDEYCQVTPLVLQPRI
ncbi:hypothetical protein QR680_019081 [Steinernema hermaphroditum]|uniref:Potassium channel domain-containing protein n=1 Tax=Steinernema hermaphroditum TaxID=289476 RepID=A0AA39HL72_9BILA|nr:hypothetical protein QR680_019081 [Steinernema hermaphroditum]